MDSNVIFSSQDYENSFDFYEDVEFMQRYYRDESITKERLLFLNNLEFKEKVEKGRRLKAHFYNTRKEIKKLYYDITNNNIDIKNLIVRDAEKFTFLDGIFICKKDINVYNTLTNNMLYNLLDMLIYKN